MMESDRKTHIVKVKKMLGGPGLDQPPYIPFGHVL